jgi:uncharacterized tellurite resistance protein B-like protein
VSLLRFIGLDSSRARAQGDTETVRRIAATLDALPPERARYLAAFAYVLARVASADLRIDEAETAKMQDVVTAHGQLPEGAAALVVEIAKSQARLLGGTENYVVTREFVKISTREQRADLLRCLFAVGAADGTISGAESAEIAAIAEEIGFPRAEVSGLRAQYRAQLSELQGLPSSSGLPE